MTIAKRKEKTMKCHFCDTDTDKMGNFADGIQRPDCGCLALDLPTWDEKLAEIKQRVRDGGGGELGRQLAHEWRWEHLGHA
jgi:hypothetical protein